MRDKVVMGEALVQIGGGLKGRRSSISVPDSVSAGLGNEGAGGQKTDNGLSRRNFLKVLSSVPVITAAGCSDSTKHKAYPNVFGQEDSIPGVSVWYNSTCQECSAGCGITVRTREGRALKIEGNRNDPLSKGGLCALGQSSLQALYDPDRIRQPLLRKAGNSGEATFEPISWADALKRLQAAFAFAGSDFALLTGEQSGSYSKLTKSFAEQLGGRRVVYDPLSSVEQAEAARLVFGEYGVPTYRFEEADVVVNFGADFLETWNSPCEYARRWADSRRGKNHTRYIHIEPRLSLTGANADRWFTCSPESELEILTFMIRYLMEKGRGSSLSDQERSGIRAICKDASLERASRSSGIEEKELLLVTEKLAAAKSGVVLAGGSATRTAQGLEVAVAAALLNLVLGAVGKVVDIGLLRKPESDRNEVAKLVGDMSSGKVKLLVVAGGTNPAFSLPNDYGFAYALQSGRVAQLKSIAEQSGVSDDTPFVVSLTTAFDETAKLADLILPTHHSLEDWGDVESVSGIRSIVQPVMTPVFDTKSLGDILLTVASGLKAELASGGAVSSFQEYVKNEWRSLHASTGSLEGFGAWWMQALERGGVFGLKSSASGVTRGVDSSVFKLQFVSAGKDKSNKKDLTLLPYFSVKSFDGRAANRPWLQELPDPIVQAVWDAWGEIHSKTAKELGVKAGDNITVRNKYGELNVPVYVSDRIAPGVVAVPVGQGHTEYGRYAREVSHVGNVFHLIPKVESERKDLPLVGARVSVLRALKKTPLVTSQITDSQAGRGLARTLIVDKSHHDGAHGGHDTHHAAHHEPKQMYEQRVHPLYEWVLGVDLAACTGCAACVTACYAENNIPTVGKQVVYQGREMSWLRIDRYFDERPETGSHGGHGDSHEAKAEEFTVSFMPMMCQHCNNAPCEPVCPVYATYHNEEGLNVMAYNRCVGTRYCSNNCSYKVRRFNWFEFDWPEPMNLQLNPDVTKRAAGVMEKCTFCVQRIKEGQDRAKDAGRPVLDGEIQPACVQSCPTQALSFGNIKDPNSKVSQWSNDSRSYKVLDHHLNTQPSVIYLENVKYKV